MRLPVSLKVFLVFCALATTTVGLGVVVFFGARDLRAANAKIEAAKDFQIQVKKLELHSRARRGLASGREDFGEQFGEAQALAASIGRLGVEFPPHLRPQVGSLSEQLRYFRVAFEELFAHYEADRVVRQEQRALGDAAQERLAGLPAAARLRLAPLLHRIDELSQRAFEDRDPSAIPRLRAAADEVRRASPDAELTRQADRLCLNTERAYLNHLAIRDKERFLGETGERFSEVAAEAVGAISRASRRRQEQLTLAVAGAIASSALLTLLLWAATRRYLHRALSHVNQSIGSIRAGIYDYEVPNVPDDEVGDLTLFLRELAGSLEQSVRRAMESEERFRALVEDISDWVWETDRAGRFVYSSPVVQRLLGVDPRDVLGKTPEDLMPAEEAARMGALLRLALEERRSGNSVEATFRGPDDTRVVLEASWQPVLDQGGDCVGIRGISRDVTERKRGEEEQARLRSQLLHAQKMEAIGTLTGGIAHDFNNLLQSVSGYTELLLRGKPEGDPDVPRLRTIEKAARRAADLTRQLLVFGRKVENRVEVLDLNDEVAQVQELLGRTIPKMISIRLRLAPGLWKISADAAQLEQVLVNLAVNAKDAMPDGGVLEFATENVEVAPADGAHPVPSGRTVHLSVSDTGHGMEAATVDHIFEPFFTTKAVGKGTGLGLAIVYAVVQSHRGRVHCESAPNRGTVFHVYLPASCDAAVHSAPRDAGAPVQGKGGTETVLLVDDEEALLALGEEILGEAGYTTLRAHSGEAALEVLDSGPSIDLAVLDLNMPGMGGLECLREMRRRGHGARALAASGAPPGPVREELRRLGAPVVLRKPFRAAELLTAVRETLDREG